MKVIIFQGERSCKISFGVRNNLKYKMWKNCFTHLTEKLGKDNVIFEQTRLLEVCNIFAKFSNQFSDFFNFGDSYRRSNGSFNGLH